MGEFKSIDKILTIKPDKKLILLLSIAGLVTVGTTAIYTINQTAQQEATANVQTELPQIQAVTAALVP